MKFACKSARHTSANQLSLLFTEAAPAVQQLPDEPQRLHCPESSTVALKAGQQSEKEVGQTAPTGAPERRRPSLFDDLPPLAPPPERPELRSIATVAPIVRLSLGPKLTARPQLRPPPSPALTERDMPAYAEAEIADVDRLIAQVKSDRLLFGYRDVQDLFGISKATANRRMKDGLVPGVTIQNGVVSRDGGVRRFSREQLKWLLLAVRSNQPSRMATNK